MSEITDLELLAEAKRRLVTDDLRAPGGKVGTAQDLTEWGIVHALAAALERVAAERDDAMREAVDLAQWLARTAYPEVTGFKTLDYPAGVLSQIDNMLAGLVYRRLQPAEAALTAMQAQLDALATALQQISWGSPDLEPPFRAMGPSQMQAVASQALKALASDKKKQVVAPEGGR